MRVRIKLVLRLQDLWDIEDAFFFCWNLCLNQTVPFIHRAVIRPVRKLSEYLVAGYDDWKRFFFFFLIAKVG